MKELTIKEFEPLRDNLIIKPYKIETKDGYVRPQKEEDKAELGEVVKVSSEIVDIKKGDIVMFNKYSSSKIDIAEEIVVREEDVIAVKHKK